jgi:hypothetical protein
MKLKHKQTLVNLAALLYDADEITTQHVGLTLAKLARVYAMGEAPTELSARESLKKLADAAAEYVHNGGSDDVIFRLQDMAGTLRIKHHSEGGDA